MLRYPGMVLAVLLLLTAVGCGDTHDKVMGDMATSMEELGDVIAEVKDVKTAEANAGRIADIAQDMQDISERANEMEDPSEETKKELEDKYADRFDKALEKLFSEMFRVAALGEEVEKVLDEAFKKLEKDSPSPPKWFK